MGILGAGHGDGHPVLYIGVDPTVVSSGPTDAPRKGKPDTYTCATRHRNQACDEPIYKRKELDRAIAFRVIQVLSNSKELEARIDESLNEDHRAEAKALVASKERNVLELEKKANKVRKAIVETELAALGLALGMAGSRVLPSALGSLLFGITTGDPVTFIEVGTLLIAVAAIAGYIPAWKASRIDPMVALRSN